MVYRNGSALPPCHNRPLARSAKAGYDLHMTRSAPRSRRNSHIPRRRPSQAARIRRTLSLAAKALWHPVILVIFTAAVFNSITTTRPIHGLFLGIAGVALTFDRYRELNQAAQAAGCPAADTAEDEERREHEETATPAAAVMAVGGVQVVHTVAESSAARARELTRVLTLAAAGLLYVLVFAAFPRYSWPTTIAVVGLAALVVAQGWEEPSGADEQNANEYARYRTAGYLAWLAVFVFACLWELAALLQQPSLQEASYEHPTISALMDSALVPYWGRSITLALWLLLGRYLLRQAKR